jgi:hypothetical protein
MQTGSRREQEMIKSISSYDSTQGLSGKCLQIRYPEEIVLTLINSAIDIDDLTLILNISSINKN